MAEVTGEVRMEVVGHVATVTISRPSKLNSVTGDMDAQMNSLVKGINADESIRAVVLTGDGERAFCVGSDIGDLDYYGSNWTYRNRFEAGKDYARAVWLIRVPVVAAIRGYCAGGGLEMALGSDIRLGGVGSSYSAAEIRWGWHGGSGATQLLPRAVGAGYAARMLLTGDFIDADEALRVGLLQQLLPADEVLPAATALAGRIADLPPIAVQRTKHMIRMSDNLPLDAGLLVENDSFSALMMTEDAAEGRAAFAEKRPPRYEGR